MVLVVLVIVDLTLFVWFRLLVVGMGATFSVASISGFVAIDSLWCRVWR